jgi:hypothetical protein
MWELQPLAILWVFTAYYSDNFTFLTLNFPGRKKNNKFLKPEHPEYETGRKKAVHPNAATAFFTSQFCVVFFVCREALFMYHGPGQDGRQNVQKINFF